MRFTSLRTRIHHFGRIRICLVVTNDNGLKCGLYARLNFGPAWRKKTLHTDALKLRMILPRISAAAHVRTSISERPLSQRRGRFPSRLGKKGLRALNLYANTEKGWCPCRELLSRASIVKKLIIGSFPKVYSLVKSSFLHTA